MSFHKETHNITISGGVGSFKSDHPLRGLLWQLITEPATASTVWTLTLTDEKGEEVAGWDAEVGDTNCAFGLELPLYRDTITFSYTAVSVDEAFKVRFSVRELPYGH